MSRIGDRIKTARISKNVSLKELGRKCGVSQSYISDVESGKRIINDALIKRISSILDINLNEAMLEDEEPSFDAEVSDQNTEPEGANIEWQSALSSIIKDVPVYDINMDKVLEYKHLPIVGNKIEGHNPDRLVYIKVPDNSMRGFRLRKDDLVMIALNHEFLGERLYFIEEDRAREIRHIKKLDGNNILISSQDASLKTRTCDIHGISIIGYLIKAEIMLLTH
jgi:transcriptional regulator with XRE-family HTH domain